MTNSPSELIRMAVSTCYRPFSKSYLYSHSVDKRYSFMCNALDYLYSQGQCDLNTLYDAKLAINERLGGRTFEGYCRDNGLIGPNADILSDDDPESAAFARAWWLAFAGDLERA